MAETTYITRVGAFGHLRNREAIEKAAMEGRTVPPLVDYLPMGSQVKLDPSDDRTKRLVASGSIAEPGKVEEQRKQELQAELDRLNAEADQLKAQADAAAAAETPPEQLKGKALDEALEAAGLPKDGNADEKRARLAAAQSGDSPPAA